MIKYGEYEFVFDYDLLATRIMSFTRYNDLTMAELDQLAGIGSGNCANILAGMKNSKMATWLSIVNAMDDNPSDYFYIQYCGETGHRRNANNKR